MSYAYYIIKNGEENGPYTYEELTRNHLSITTKVLSTQTGIWEEACNLPELDDYFKSSGIYLPAITNLASFWWRLLAYFIDFILIEAGALFLMNELAIKRVIDSHKPLQLLLSFVALHVVLILYNTICEAIPLKGSIGKKICKLVVVDLDGNGITFLNALKRNTCKIISRLVVYMGFIRIFWDEHRQGWHDEFAGTYIVKRK